MTVNTKLSKVEDISLNNKSNQQISIEETKEKLDKNVHFKILKIKRFYERWMADSNFRDQLPSNPTQVIELYNLEIEPEEVRPIWDKDFADKFDNDTIPSEYVYYKHFRDIYLNKTKPFYRDISLENDQFEIWRERQIARTVSQFHPQHHDAIGHIPVCFELSKGCSVGCWFCGVSAPRLEDIFVYNKENAQLWQDVLKLIKDTVGASAGQGFCYWATDPLDNPDYEKFCTDFHEILGVFPQTTTAQAWKQPQRVRSLLKLSEKKGFTRNRFSILSLKILNQIHEQFSVEELAHVDLVFQNPGALSSKAEAGRAREKSQKTSNVLATSDTSLQESIACVTGFLFNMVEKTVKLISPCPANEEYPNGYIIFEQGNFCDIKELKNILEKMIANHMDLSLRDNDIICFRSDMVYERISSGFKLSARYLTRNFNVRPYLQDVADFICKGNQPVGQIIAFSQTLGISRAETLYFLTTLFNKGVFEINYNFLENS
ncbi:MAG: radical SAM family RiPP maturation amino acid epimerase [Scytonematopsis contorta HA4267-MV1]|jgi:radical SAM family RiPP maturation amino acid epimerase|nr:radical SAM family RiPP maturation amino acid epimerase [Scytonematopsis contorta HA4267-MV1]